MRKLYGPTSWRRVLALVVVFAMLFSAMGSSGYSVFAESMSETGAGAAETLLEAGPEETAEAILEESSGEDESSAPAEDAEETEALSEEEAEGRSEEAFFGEFPDPQLQDSED